MVSRHTGSTGGERREAYNLLEDRLAWWSPLNPSSRQSEFLPAAERDLEGHEYFGSPLKKSIFGNLLSFQTWPTHYLALPAAVCPRQDADAMGIDIHLLPQLLLDGGKDLLPH